MTRTQCSGRWVFDIQFGTRSPGQILLRHLGLMTLDPGMHTCDMGLGDQADNFRPPSRVVSRLTRGLEPPAQTATDH